MESRIGRVTKDTATVVSILGVLIGSATGLNKVPQIITPETPLIAGSPSAILPDGELNVKPSRPQFGKRAKDDTSTNKLVPSSLPLFPQPNL